MTAVELTTSTIATLDEQVQSALGWAEPTMVIEDDAQRKNAEDLLIVLRQARKTAEDKRLEITRPLDETKKRVMELFKPHIARLDTVINLVSNRLAEYHAAQQRAVKEAQDLLLQEAANRMREARETGEVVSLPALTPEAMPEARTTNHANLGSVTYRETWDIRIVDQSKLPRDLLVPDMPRIRARVRSGADVPGVVAVKRLVPAARANR